MALLGGLKRAFGGALAGWRAHSVDNASTTLPLSSGTKGGELYEWLTGNASLSSAGPVVNERTSMSIGAVYACVALISGAVSSLPFHVYRREGESRQRVNNDLWWLLNEQPTPSMSAAVFWEYLVWSLLLHGDAFARIVRAAPMSPQIVGFIPYHPLDVDPLKNGDRLAYRINDKEKGYVVIDQDDMLHIPGLGFDGLRGMSPVRHNAKQSMGISLAADDYSATFFGNGARPDYIVSLPGTMREDQIKVFRESWMARYGGTANRHTPAILTNGGDVKTLSISPKDAMLIETRNFQAADIARFYGVPPHMIGLTDKVTSWGTGIAEQAIGFVQFTLQRHLTKIKQEVNRKCFRTERFFAEFSTSGLERGDYKARNEGYRIALGRAGEPGWMTPNEVRKLENMPPIDGGDTINSGVSANGPAA